eukprot:6175015-Pyramimonas_sp.AAC.1
MAQVIVRKYNVWCNASGKPWRNQPVHSHNSIMTLTTVLPPLSLCWCKGLDWARPAHGAWFTLRTKKAVHELCGAHVPC